MSKILVVDDDRTVLRLVERALQTRRMMRVPVAMATAARPAVGEFEGEQDMLVGRSPEMLDVYKEIGRVAAQDVSVLICGESGTGKELIARAIYHHSRRSDACFLAVNCAALSDTLLESELFGHEKGAFTGADRRRIGKFEQYNGGTIFLDEVGDMSPLTQSKVLRLLQEQEFERVGGTETMRTDVRSISATNRDLERMIGQDKFRLDLFHRLNGAADREAIESSGPLLPDRAGYGRPFAVHAASRRRRSGATRPVVRPHALFPARTDHAALAAVEQDASLQLLPVVVMTTSDAQSDRAKAYQHYANSYVVKPVDFEKFRQMLDDLSLYWGAWNESPLGE